MNLLAQIMHSCVMIFNICYHAGGVTKHLRPPKVERRNEESSPSDALTPKEKKTRLAGKMRTYLWARPLTPTPPTPCSLSLLSQNKNAWIQQNGMNRCGTQYSLFSHLDALL